MSRPRAALGAAAAQCLAGTVTVALAERPASGAFTGISGSAGNSVATAAQFCAGTGSATVGDNTTLVDTYLSQAEPTKGWGGSRDLYVRSYAAANMRALLRFTLPAVPAGCSVTGATLSMRVTGTSDTSRTIGAYRIDPAAPQWDENAVTWSTQPPVTADTPATSAPVPPGGDQVWTVTDLVRAQYADGNNGFLIRDQAEDAAAQSENRYRSREDGFAARLTVSWG